MRRRRKFPSFTICTESSPQIKQVIDLALKLEGMCRNAGVHAAGVIIADQPLDSVIRMCKDKEDNLLTQFEGPIAEKCRPAEDGLSGAAHAHHADAVDRSRAAHPRNSSRAMGTQVSPLRRAMRKIASISRRSTWHDQTVFKLFCSAVKPAVCFSLNLAACRTC